jgi:hypothetical protein
MTTACALDKGPAAAAAGRTFALEAELCEVLVAGVPETLGWGCPGPC